MSKVFELSPTQRSQVVVLKSAVKAATNQTARVEAWVALQAYLSSLVDAVPESRIHLTRNDLAVLYQKKDA